MAELRGELPFHRHRLDQSPLSPALCAEATHHLLWFNFAHLFSMSLLPLSTAWMAVSELAPQPVAFYAAVFFLVNATYICLIWELVDRNPGNEISPRVRRIMRVRSIATLCLFGAAAVVALKYPLPRTRNLYRLPDRLSETRAAGREEASISLGAGGDGSMRGNNVRLLRRATCRSGAREVRRTLPLPRGIASLAGDVAALATTWLPRPPAKTWPPGS